MSSIDRMRKQAQRERDYEYREQKRKHALMKARKRGEVAVNWFNAGNKLTPETQAEFNALMKKTDNEFTTP